MKKSMKRVKKLDRSDLRVTQLSAVRVSCRSDTTNCPGPTDTCVLGS